MLILAHGSNTPMNNTGSITEGSSGLPTTLVLYLVANSATLGLSGILCHTNKQYTGRITEGSSGLQTIPVLVAHSATLGFSGILYHTYELN